MLPVLVLVVVPVLVVVVSVVVAAVAAAAVISGIGRGDKRARRAEHATSGRLATLRRG